jgi:hypothetical protein
VTTTVAPATTAPSVPPVITTVPAPAAPSVAPSAVVTSALAPASSGCPLRTLAAAATAEEVAAAFVAAYGTVAAADDQSARLACLRTRLADPLASPVLVPPWFTADQVAAHWRLHPTRAPAFALDEDSSQAADHVVLTGTMWAEVEQDSAPPVATVSQLLVELVRPNGLWLVATMSDRTVSP